MFRCSKYRRAIAMRVFLCLLVLTFAGCTDLFLLPSSEPLVDPEEIGLHYEVVAIRTAGEPDLYGWLLNPKSSVQATILFLHGNAGNISSHLGAVAWLPQYGYRVFMLDYRGYGNSEGSAGLAGMHADVLRALSYIEAEVQGGEPLIIYGQSLGGTLALMTAQKMADREKIALIISEGAFASYPQMARYALRTLGPFRYLLYPFTWFVSDEFDLDRGIVGDLQVPIILVHGEYDQVVPVENVQRLKAVFAGAGQPWIVPGGRHIDAFNRVELRRRLLQRLKAVNPETPVQ